MAPLVSVIVNCRNGERFLREALESVYAQSFQDFEIIFFDNQSTDKSREIAESYDLRVKYHSSTTYLTLGEARNQAITYATGNYIAFLDADDIWMPDKLEQQIRYFDKDPEISFIYTNFWVFHQEMNTNKPGLEGMQPEGMISNMIILHYNITLSTVIVKRSTLLKQSVLFDPVLEYYEEYDLFIRFLRNNKAGYIPEFLAIWRDHAQNTTRNYKKAFEYGYLLDKYRNEGIIQGNMIPLSFIRLMRVSVREKNYSLLFRTFFSGIKKSGLSLICAGIHMYIKLMINKNK